MSSEELLDKTDKPKKKKDKSYYTNRTIIYIVCMFVAGFIYTLFVSKLVLFSLINSLILTLSSIVIAIPIELIRKYLRNRKAKENPSVEEEDPLWFHVIESALSLLILFLALFLILRTST